MIEKINLSTLKREFSKFKESKDYANRKSQLRFVEIAQLILKELVKRDKITNDDLTSLIQTLAANCKKETFLKYLKNLQFPKDKEDMIYEKFITYGETGYTGRGMAAMRGLNESQLEAVHELLKSVSVAKNREEVKRAWEEYKDKRVPKVTSGIYSPWLYYLQPQICPLIAGSVTGFFQKLGWQWDTGYGDLIDFFEEMKSLVGEEDLGLLDQFFWDEKSRNSIISSSKDQVQDSLMSLFDNKKQIILYGPPGTGKTYKTKRIAIKILEKEI